MDRKRVLIVAAAVTVAALAVLLAVRGDITQRFFDSTGSRLPEGLRREAADPLDVVARDLAVPWEMAFLPGGDMLVTERPGTLRRIGADERTYQVSGVERAGEGGLLGLALHPSFESNRLLYLYLTTRSKEGLINRVERYRYENDRLLDKTTIIDNIPGAPNHDGGRMAFGPDKRLYITTGDAGRPELAQDKNSLAGKILRLADDGKIPPDNPFNSAVYSYGHRNPQGITWDTEGRLWATEHGRSGLRSGFDELNLIEYGANYGWPVIEGDAGRAGMIKPIVHSGADETWAPAGLAYANGSLFFTGLRGQALYEAKIDGRSVTLKSHYRGEFGRLRAAVAGPGNALYISTSNTDGRGQQSDGDDRIIRLSLELFKN